MTQYDKAGTFLPLPLPPRLHFFFDPNFKRIVLSVHVIPFFIPLFYKERCLVFSPLISESGNTEILQEVYPFMIFCCLKA